MNNNGTLFTVLIRRVDGLEEVKERGGQGRDILVWPVCVVELEHGTLGAVANGLEEDNKDEQGDREG